METKSYSASLKIVKYIIVKIKYSADPLFCDYGEVKIEKLYQRTGNRPLILFLGLASIVHPQRGLWSGIIIFLWKLTKI